MDHPTPDKYQPKLYWYSHLWRYLAALAISLLVWSTIAQAQWEEHRTLLWLDVALGLVSFVLMVLRRRWPFTIAMVVTVLGAASALSLGPGTVAAVSLATRRRLPQIVAIGAVGLVVGHVYPVVQPVPEEPWWVTFAVNLSFTVALLAVGMYIGSRRELLWTLRERAARAETEQELRAERARTGERARIAREMHDVLAHRISLVSMHAGALTYRTDLTPAEVAASAEIIQQNAHQALVDLRQVLGVLRSDELDAGKDLPQPTFAEIDSLVVEASHSDMRINFRSEVDDSHLMPDQTGRTVYRIVQEALTNARKHALGAKVQVAIAGGPGRGVDVSVHNLLVPGSLPRATGAGLGLVGLAERTQLAGGRLRHALDHRSFRLEAWLPWEA